MTLNLHYAPICALRNANFKVSELIAWELVKMDFYCRQQKMYQDSSFGQYKVFADVGIFPGDVHTFLVAELLL